MSRIIVKKHHKVNGKDTWSICGAVVLVAVVVVLGCNPKSQVQAPVNRSVGEDAGGSVVSVPHPASSTVVDEATRPPVSVLYAPVEMEWKGVKGTFSRFVITVSFRPNTPDATIARVLNGHQLVVVDYVDGWYGVYIGPSRSVEAAIAELGGEPTIAIAEPSSLGRLQGSGVQRVP